MGFELTSPAFLPGGKIPRVHGCDGKDLSPPLSWHDPPKGTASFLLLCEDPESEDGPFRHWVAYDIPEEWSGLPQGNGLGQAAEGFRQAINDYGRVGYAGPCPPIRGEARRYVFRLLALSEPSLEVPLGASAAETIAAAEPHLLASAELVAFYER